ncbi:hypothetical protein K523DRAFT_316633 [Schizophyllum commune Tattone D]|nr:hypothetical protein K523DRAFT_316633 [Schizophyllum commune Tattone D]
MASNDPHHGPSNGATGSSVPAAAAPLQTPSTSKAQAPTRAVPVNQPTASGSMAAPTAYLHSYPATGATSTVFRATPPTTAQAYQPSISAAGAPTQAQSFYNYPAQNWQHWQPTFSAFPNSQTYYQTAGYTPATLAKTDGKPPALTAHQTKPAAAAAAAPPPRRPPTPPPPDPVLPRHWDEVLMDFFKAVGFTQTRKGFEMDVLVMNPEWEKKRVAGALQRLVQGLTVAHDPSKDDAESIEERKLAYTHKSNLQPSTSINKSISQFLAQNRSRNDASNRAEFVDSLKRKRQKADDGDAPADGTDVADATDEASGSCARTDARHVDRDAQMKYDIAKNEDGPLKRTMKKEAEGQGQAGQSAAPTAAPGKSAGGPADLSERVTAVEQHLSLQYVPTPPNSVAARLKMIEDHITHLERDYPPWAALHFNQPNRGWPPPPRTTPVIVPVHLRSVAAPPPVPQTNVDTSNQPTSSRTRTKSSSAQAKNSSLQRAVLERLEVQQARRDLAGQGGGG